MTTTPADTTAFAKINAVRPQLSGIVRLRDLPGTEGRLLLHAGPPFAAAGEIPVPVMNALAIVALREGWATDGAEATQMIRSGAIRLGPAQDYGVLVPLAGAVGPSTALLVVSDANDSTQQRFSPINEGMTLCTRLGILHPDLPDHLRWLDGPVADWIGEALEQPIDLYPVLREALAQGDDCHSRTVAGSAALIALLAERDGPHDPDGEVRAFLKASPAFALNVWMAMCGLMAAAAEGCEGSMLVTRAGGNGHSFGYQVASQPGHWIIVPAPAINGRIEPAHEGRHAAPALGDSALVDFMGLGGQALDAAPQVAQAMKELLPVDAADRPGAILQGWIEGFGRPGVTNAARAAAAGVGPMVLLGMIDASGEAGRIGGGCAAVDGSVMAESLIPA
ncbi:DUF1116 domain-containing protein [Primorskyibacter flagellatus]|uniref:oxamate carbamoyltransferase subunit AllG family protein n=1 Tax=Primorskyibacter flagellatus TaxID=1387277 RepID=UPI003A8FD416